MKKIIFLFSLTLLAIAANAQRGIVQNLPVDTLKGDNNKAVATVSVSGSYESMFINLKVDRISTAAGGTFYLKAGIDSTSAEVLTSTNSPSVEFISNDTMSTTDVATQYFNILVTEPGARYYYILGDGDASDTVKVTTRLILK
jgi:hypothetical protein